MNTKGNITTTSYLAWEEFKRLLSMLKSDGKSRTHMLYATCGYTGLRIGDVLKLTWGDISSDKITIKESKTGKTRTIMINSDLKNIIDQSRGNSRSSALIFTNREGKKAITRTYVNAELKRAFNKYNIDYKGNISSHLFRKTLGRRYLEKTDYDTKSLILLMEMFNHSSPETTKRYLGIRQDEIDEIYITL